MSKILLTDLDGVVLDWFGTFLHWLDVQKINYKGDAERDDYSLSDIVDHPDPESLVIEFNSSTYFRYIPAYVDAMIYLPKVKKELGYEIVAITSCSDKQKTIDLRTACLEDLFGKGFFKEINCIPLGGDKLPLLKGYAPTYWIEDNTKNALKGIEAGHKVILMNKDYNEKDKAKGCIRLENWEDIYKELSK